MKRCSTCKEHKSLTEFNRNRTRSDGYSSTCRDCMKGYRATHYGSNRGRLILEAVERNRRRREELAEELREYLNDKSCLDCGIEDSRVLEFDHREDETKVSDIARMISNGLGWDTILTEIAKCDVRCANCHRIVTYERAGLARSFW